MVSLIEALVLSIIQGVTEWFPVSSSGHLALFHSLFGFQSLSYDVFLHLASVLAVLVVFWEDIIKLLDIREKRNLYYIGLLILAVIPAFLFGVLLRDYIVKSFQSLFFVGLFFISSGVIIFMTKFSHNRRFEIKTSDSLFVGLMQVFALFPGISRSGMTISAGMFAGLKKEEAIRFSFLLAIPVILGASLAEAGQIFNLGVSYWILIVSFIVTFLVSLIVIKLLLRIIKKGKFWWFGVYDVVLGLLVLVWSLV